MLLDSGPPQARPFVAQSVIQWQKSTALASIRDEEALAKLTGDERKAFTQLWADIAAVLQKAEALATTENER